MKIRVCVFSLCFVFMLSLPALAQGAYTVSVEQLNETLYKISSSAYSTNMVASIGEDGLLLVDTGPSFTANLLVDALDSLGIGTPSFIINTHAHTDHTGGNAAFANDPVIIAHKLVRNRLRSGIYIIQEFPDKALPDICFVDSMSIFFNGENISIYAVPGAHTDHDALVVFETSKVVYTGSIFLKDSFPGASGNSGDANNFPDVLQKALTYIPEDATIVPAHGPLSTKTDMRDYHTMLIETISLVRDELVEGKTVEQMQEASLFAKYERYNTLGVNNADGWIANIARDQGERIRRKSLVEPLYHALVQDGVTAFITRFNELKATGETEYNFNEGVLNQFGYYLLLRDRLEEAIMIFEINVDEYPESFNVYDSLAEAFMKSGNNEKARQYYEKSLEINPNNTNAVEMMQRLQ